MISLRNVCCLFHAFPFQKRRVQRHSQDEEHEKELDEGHACRWFFTVHLDLLLVQLLQPNVRGLPLLDLSSESGAFAVYTYTNSGGNNWPYVLVGIERARCHRGMFPPRRYSCDCRQMRMQVIALKQQRFEFDRKEPIVTNVDAPLVVSRFLASRSYIQEFGLLGLVPSSSPSSPSSETSITASLVAAALQRGTLQHVRHYHHI